MAVEGVIGPFAFFVARPINMKMRQPRIETLQFSGVDDAAYRLLGEGSEVWQLQTRVEAISENQGWEVLAGYAALIDQGLLSISLGSVNFEPYQARVKVLSIDPGFGDVPPVRFEKLVGGVNLNGSLWIVSATWSLQWFKTPTPDP